jgi:hypothetical protein
MTPFQIAAFVATLLLTAAAVFQLLLAMGLPLGQAAWGGQHKILPQRLRWGSMAAALTLVIAAWVILARAGLAAPASDNQAVRIGCWFFAGMFALNTVGNLASKSAIERRVMTPATLLLLACFVTVARSAI